MRSLAAIAALVLAGTVSADSAPIVLARPHFEAPVRQPAQGPVRFRIVSSSPLDPGRLLPTLRPPGLRLQGGSGDTAHLVLSPGRYAYDFRNYAWPPRIAAGEREFVYERVRWAKEADGVLYVETAHDTYARSSFGLNGYLNAIDLRTHRLRWRSPALVANADTFVIAGDVVVTGYGFTAEPDYLYAIDRRDGHVAARILLPTAPELIVRHGRTLTIDTYDRRVVVRLLGA